MMKPDLLAVWKRELRLAKLCNLLQAGAVVDFTAIVAAGDKAAPRSTVSMKEVAISYEVMVCILLILRLFIYWTNK